jgi:hypothetical protein
MGESVNNLSVIHFKGDQHSMKALPPAMLKTIKSELEEDDDLDHEGDECTIGMEFEQERIPQRSN